MKKGRVGKNMGMRGEVMSFLRKVGCGSERGRRGMMKGMGVGIGIGLGRNRWMRGRIGGGLG